MLGRHICDGAEHGSGTGEVLSIGGRDGFNIITAGSALVDDLRQPEIENLGVSALGNKDVGRLDVAMNNAFRVRRIQSVRDLDG